MIKPTTIVIASHNQGKIKELEALMAPLSIKLIPQIELNISEVAETAATFIENALLKARHAALASQLPTMADDSGLIVPFLKGEPGLYSARYAGPDATAQDNINLLLGKLESASDAQRQAYFYCAIVYLQHAFDPAPIIAEGRWYGKIILNQCGSQGFGYDPIFFDNQHHNTAAQLPLALKNKISHRGQAMQAFISKLKQAL